MAYQSFEELEVWKRSTKLAIEVINQLKECRDYAFKNQMMKCAISVPSNIAEGAERQTKKEFRYFLNVSKGSAGEFRTQLYIAMGTALLPKDDVKDWIDELKELSAMLQGLIQSLENA